LLAARRAHPVQNIFVRDDLGTLRGIR